MNSSAAAGRCKSVGRHKILWFDQHSIDNFNRVGISVAVAKWREPPLFNNSAWLFSRFIGQQPSIIMNSIKEPRTELLVQFRVVLHRLYS